MAESDLRPIGTLVELAEREGNQRIVYIYQVIGHVLSLDGSLSEILQLRSKDTLPGVGPEQKKPRQPTVLK